MGIDYFKMRVEEMAASITEITRIQRLIKSFEEMAKIHSQARDFLQQIEKEYHHSNLISLEALKGLDSKSQQELATLLEDLVDKMSASQLFSKDEEKSLQEIVRQANSKQQELNLKQPGEQQTGLELIKNGKCALISLETFNCLDPRRQERLAILVGREGLQQMLSQQDQKSMANLVQFAHVQQKTAVLDLKISTSPLKPISSSAFFSAATPAVKEIPVAAVHDLPQNN